MRAPPQGNASSIPPAEHHGDHPLDELVGDQIGWAYVSCIVSVAAR
jgi:hypothetical protein